MSEDPDSTAALRRSKRNKFHLDVAAMHHGRSRSPAIVFLHPVPVASEAVIKNSPRDSPIVFPKDEPIQSSSNVATDDILLTASPKKYTPKKPLLPSREETATPESLGKRKRKAAVCDDFSYSIDSEDDSEAALSKIEYVTDTPGIKVSR